MDTISQSLSPNKQPDQNFWFRFFWKKIYVLKEKRIISQILSQKENELTYINYNFNRVVGHTHSINSYDSSTTQWVITHKCLKQALPSTNEMKCLLEKYKGILLSNEPQKFIVKERLEEYLLKVWSEFTYGEKVDYYRYIECRNLICKYLKYNFHESYLIKIPVLGSIYSYYINKKNNMLLRDIYTKIDILNRLSYDNKQGYMYNFTKEMMDQNNVNTLSSRENGFLLFLVIDFISKVMLDYVLRTSINKNKNIPIIPNEIFAQSLANGFLYPYRFRCIKSEIVSESFKLNKGDITIMDMKRSGLYFSSGPRTCIGQGLTKSAFYEFFTNNILKEKFIRLEGENLVDISYKDESSDIPEISWPYQGIWSYEEQSKEKILSQIKSYDGHNGVKYMNILSLYHDPQIFGQIVDDLSKQINNTCVDGLVVIETRGLSLGGAIANKLRLPLYTIRKKGKLPGDVYSQEYKMAYDSGVVELSKDDNIMGKKIVLIDDGIASGGTVYACIKLVEEAGGNVVKIVTMVNHCYKDRDIMFVPYNGLVYSYLTIPKADTKL